MRVRSSFTVSTPAPSSSSAYSGPTPLMRNRSAMLTHLRTFFSEIPVASAISLRPAWLQPFSRSASVSAQPQARSFSP